MGGPPHGSEVSARALEEANLGELREALAVGANSRLAAFVALWAFRGRGPQKADSCVKAPSTAFERGVAPSDRRRVHIPDVAGLKPRVACTQAKMNERASIRLGKMVEMKHEGREIRASWHRRPLTSLEWRARC